ncbi:hypothetical protein [Amycolatopsis sp. NPDC057786]|uniref:hypothetical protein n=1 Tax=Amycolatopsis sp. NPDC057786 TaxID=3346250 RepID=UPI00366B34CB
MTGNAPRVVGQVLTGAAFTVFFGLVGAGAATAQPCNKFASTGGGCTPDGGGKKVESRAEFRPAAPQKQEKKAPAKKRVTHVRPDKDDKKSHRSKDDDKDEKKDRDDDKKDDRKRDDKKDDKRDKKEKKDDRKDRDDDKKDDKKRDAKKDRDKDKDRHKNREKDEDEGRDKRRDKDDDKARDKKDDKGKNRARDKDEDRDDNNEPTAEPVRAAKVTPAVRPATATSIPTVKPVSLKKQATPPPWGGYDIVAPSWCNDGCKMAMKYLEPVVKAFNDAITPDSAGLKVEGFDGKGKIFSIEGHRFYAQGTWYLPDGTAGGEYSVGADGKLELKFSKMLIPEFEASALLGAKISGPEHEADLGPLLTKVKPEVSVGVGAKLGAGFARGDDGKIRFKAEGGLTGPIGLSSGFAVEPEEDVLRHLGPR